MRKPGSNGAETLRNLRTAAIQLLAEHGYGAMNLRMLAKKVGVQATAKILLAALLRKHGIAEKDVEVVVIGSEMSPLLTGQTDVVSGWVTNTTTLKVLGPERIDMRLWDAGVRLYALPYYATRDTIAKKPELLAGFTRAAARGFSLVEVPLSGTSVQILKGDGVGLMRGEPFVAGIIFQGDSVKDDFAGQNYFKSAQKFYFCGSHLQIRVSLTRLLQIILRREIPSHRRLRLREPGRGFRQRPASNLPWSRRTVRPRRTDEIRRLRGANGRVARRLD